GAIVSIRTVAVFAVSTLPAASVERYVIVCGPSFEWSAGAGIETDVPVVYVAAPSILYCVEATPEPEVSVALSVTVTAVLLHPAGALSVVAGAVVSIRTVADFAVSVFVAASVER